MRVYLLFFDDGESQKFIAVYNSLSKAIAAGNKHAKEILVWSKRDEDTIISGDPKDHKGYVIEIEDGWAFFSAFVEA